ncbi:HAD family hydrolase [Streptomyces montanisoli]|uniref:HAD-IB family hydrolase n=1 Tax=Streptomyces montanisoli TaxID=2798581 RepID=A0A940MEZ1_9ACTN|nr:HAD-IB family hydrolase [Streptomyces montanisoli]MBP0458780.1 HAD-IB family hydrolase [Streptomyces montanisoli]
MGAARFAFFDVDETLIDVKSMFSFLDFHLADPVRYQEVVGRLAAMAADGVPRERTNRLYYRAYAGMSQESVARSGREWFGTHAARPGFFHGEVVAELTGLRARGAAIVLVSGSFRACLDPIAAHLGASHVLCTEPETAAGRYTGRVPGAPMIGERKAAAARALMRQAGARPQDCFAYGDHPSDLPLLRSVGSAGVVGDAPELVENATRFGWTRLRQAVPAEPIHEGA